LVTQFVHDGDAAVVVQLYPNNLSTCVDSFQELAVLLSVGDVANVVGAMGRRRLEEFVEYSESPSPFSQRQ